jgi:hypothetical protein
MDKIVEKKNYSKNSIISLLFMGAHHLLLVLVGFITRHHFELLDS